MARTAAVLFVTAVLVASVDLAQKANALSQGGFVVGHERSPTIVLGVFVLVAVWTAAILWSGSRAIALGGGMLVGGAVGNVVSLLAWPSFAGVPDPLVVGTVAFNLGDVAVT